MGCGSSSALHVAPAHTVTPSVALGREGPVPPKGKGQPGPSVAALVQAKVPWEVAGYERPRRERSEWIEMMANLLRGTQSVHSRDQSFDMEVICGREIDPAKLAKVKRVVRFLVSSTFTDTALERNLFLGDALPELQELGRRLKMEVHMVEMRWGIRAPASNAHLTSEICMRELGRCIRESLGVSYVFLATQKYGFCLLPRLIPEEVFEELMQHVAEAEDCALLQEWFKLDENSAAPKWLESGEEWHPPPDFYGPGRCYVLQSRERFADGEWWPRYEQMQSSLRKAAHARYPEHTSPEALRDPKNTHFAQRFFISVTEEELKRGLLWVMPERQKQQTLVLRRSFQDPPSHKDWIDMVEVKVDDEAQLLLSSLIAIIPPHVPQLDCTPRGKGNGKAALSLEDEEDCRYLREANDFLAEKIARSIADAHLQHAVTHDEVFEEARYHMHSASVRAAKFCNTESTQRVVEAVRGFLGSGSGSSAFVVFGRSGAGKTYLMSQIMLDHIRESQATASGSQCVVARFLGTSPASSSVHVLLSSLCEQLRRCFRKDELVPSDFKDVKTYFRTALRTWPSAEQPLSLFIDSVDQLDDSNSGRQLEWLPVTELPPHLRLVVSTLPDHAEFQCLSQLRRGLGLAVGESCGNVLEVETISEHQKMLSHLLGLQDRTITDEQMEAVDIAFRGHSEADAAGTPLWLTIVAQVVGQWASYDGVKFAIQPSVRALIIDLFQRLEHTNGAYLTRAVMGFITLCRRSGVSETELAHLASLDDDVLADVYECWVPPLRTCPPLVISMLLADLEPYLSRRGDGSGKELVCWYHRQFWEAAEHYLFGEGLGGQDPGTFVPRAQRHGQLAEYFSGRWAGQAKPYSPWLAERVQRPEFFPGETAGDRMVPAQPLVLNGSFTDPVEKPLLNTRRVHERVYHAIHAGDVHAVREDLCSVEYIAAKVVAGEVSELLREYGEAVEWFTDKDLDPELVAALSEFMAFVGRNLDALRRGVAMRAFQFAMQQPDASVIHRSLLRVLEMDWAASGMRLVVWPDKPQQQDPCQLTIQEHENSVNAVAYSPCGKWVASGSKDETIKVCSVVTGEVKCTLTGHSGSVNSVAYSPDGKHIVSGAYDKSVRIWDSTTGKEESTLTGHSRSVTSVAYSPDGKHIVSGSWDNTVKIWDAATSKEDCTLMGHSNHVNSVAYSPDGKHIVSGSEDWTVRIWDAAMGKEECALTGHSAAVNSVAFSLDGTRVVSGSGQWDHNDNSVRIWNVAILKEEFTLMGHSNWVTSVVYSPDGKYIVSGSFDLTVKVWDAQTGKEEFTLTGHSRWVRSVVYSPDGKHVVSGSEDKTVKIWDAATSKEECTLTGHSSIVRSVAYSPDGKHIVSGSGDKSVRMWDAQTGKEECTLMGHSGPVLSVAYSPDGKHVVSGSSDKTVKVWDSQTGKEECTLTGHSSYVNRVQFSDDGLHVISGSRDDTVRFWDVASSQQVRQVSGSEFTFVEGDNASEHQMGRHILTASDDMLLIYEGDAEGDAASFVACFKAPQKISSVRSNGSNICVGCTGGAVCILQAPFLAA